MDLLPRLLSSTARSFCAVRSVNEPISIARIPARRVSIDVCRDFTAASSCCDSQGTRSSVDRDRRKSRRRGRAAKTSRSNQWLPSPPPPRGNRNAARTCSGQRGIHMFEEESSLSRAPTFDSVRSLDLLSSSSYETNMHAHTLARLQFRRLIINVFSRLFQVSQDTVYSTHGSLFVSTWLDSYYSWPV